MIFFEVVGLFVDVKFVVAVPNLVFYFLLNLLSYYITLEWKWLIVASYYITLEWKWLIVAPV
jgi:hypothetical protein